MSQAKVKKFNLDYASIISLVIFLGVAIYLRVGLPYQNVFVGSAIKYTTPDAYYFMHLADNLVHNFPHLTLYDPYINYPSGAAVSGPNFFIYLLSSVIWLIGLGSPSPHTVDVVGVYFPAITAALTLIPVYFIGKTLFNKWAGIIAAGLLAILPGEFFGRTILGSTDRDALEVFFTAMTMLFLILAVKEARGKQLSLKNLNIRNWPVFGKTLIYSLLTGFSLGLYLLTWRGAFLIVIAILIYFVIQSIIDHIKGQSIEYLGVVCGIAMLVAFILFAPVSVSRMYTVSLVIAFLAVSVITALSWFLARRQMKSLYYPAGILGIGVIGVLVLFLISPALFKSILDGFSVFIPSLTEKTILEMGSILFPGGNFSLYPIWGNYTTSFFLSFIALGILIYLLAKKGQTETLPLIIWSLIVIIATLLLRRIAVLLVLNVALLTGYLGWKALQLAGLGKSAQPAEVVEMPRKNKKGREKKIKAVRPGAASHAFSIGIVAVIIFLGSYFPNFFYINPVIGATAGISFTPNLAWYESLTWLKNNSPEPMGDAGAYYDIYQPTFKYPDSAYGVAAWWDYGYWIARISHRLPNCDPGGGNRNGVAGLFTAQDAVVAKDLVSQMKTKYVVLDEDTLTGKFYAVLTYAGIEKPMFEIYYQRQGNNMVPGYLYYPEFSQSLAARLYYFDGKAVTPSSVNVYAYSERTTSEGYHFREITDTRSFPTVEAANQYIASQKSGLYKIASPNPKVSPVPLAALSDFKLVYTSKENSYRYYSQNGWSNTTLNPMKIFEYTGAR
jgi:oligosaccharyl transferase (archaeosortase A-associated)